MSALRGVTGMSTARASAANTSIDTPLLKVPANLKPETMPNDNKWLKGTADVLTALMAVGCGISTGVAFIGLSFIPASAFYYFIASIIGLVGAGINWIIFRQSVRDVLIGILGKGELFQGLFESKSTCELLTLSLEPSIDNIFDLDIKTDAAYALYKDELYYINKKSKVVEKIALSKHTDLTQYNREKLAKLEQLKALKNNSEEAQLLNYADLKEITNITGHRHLPLYKKGLILFGLLVASSVGLTFGALAYSQTLGLFAALGLLSTGSILLPYIASAVAIILVAATFISMTALMLDAIADGIKTENALQQGWNFVTNLFDWGTRTQIRSFEKELPSNESDLEIFKQDLKSLIETDYAYIKAGDAYYHYHKNEGSLVLVDVHNKTTMKALFGHGNKKLSFKELHSLEKATDNQKVRTSRGWVILERILTSMLTVLTIPLAVLGLFMTMNACAPGLKQLMLTYAPRLSATVVDIGVTVVAMGFAFVGQIPFAIQTTVNTIKSFFEKKIEEGSHIEVVAKKVKLLDEEYPGLTKSSDRLVNRLKVAALYGGAVINAIGNGLISMMGASKSGLLSFILSGVGGFWNSLAAGIASINRSLSKDKASEGNLTTSQVVTKLNSRRSSSADSDNPRVASGANSRRPSSADSDIRSDLGPDLGDSHQPAIDRASDSVVQFMQAADPFKTVNLDQLLKRRANGFFGDEMSIKSKDRAGQPHANGKRRLSFDHSSNITEQDRASFQAKPALSQ
jgi:hypothetical protein